MAKNKKGRVYWRNQGGIARAYGDFRDVGGKQEALIPKGETRATSDPVVAQKLVGDRLAELQEQKRDGALLGLRRRAGLGEYAQEHLTKKKRSGRVTDGTLSAMQQHLQVACDFFGEGRDVGSIGVADVQRFVEYLSELPSGRTLPDGTPATLKPNSQRRYLASLSNLYTRAQGEGLVQPGYNPVAALMDKPIGRPAESPWLEVWEAALLLEAARTFPYDGPEDSTAAKRLRQAIGTALGVGHEAEAAFVRRMQAQGMLRQAEALARYLSGEAIPTKRFLLTAARVLELPEDRLHRPRGSVAPAPDRSAHPLLATWLLTGARETEAYGLQLGDVNLKRKTITYRENAHRRLKTRTSHRTVPYWPQLQEVLEPHLERRREEGATERDLVFVSQRTGKMLNDTRKTLDAIAARAGWEAGEIRSKMFRHTYCATRLQTLDRGAPVSVYTVSRELGHGGDSLVKRVYGHLGELRHRSEVVEYRIEQQRDVIPRERLRLLLQVA